MSTIINQIQENAQWQEMLKEEQIQLAWKAMQSNDPVTLMKAQQLVDDISKRVSTNQKSLLIDPIDFANNLEYKHPRKSASYGTLRRMAYTPIIHSIITTRVDQVASFCEPQKSKYDVGFVIRKKKDADKMTKRDEYIAEDLTSFVLNCGVDANKWHGDDFDTFTRKVIFDSLAMDQMTFEIIRDRKGTPVEYLATDAATFRLSDSIDDAMSSDKQRMYGYTPSYCQVLDETVMAEFYPWELCMGIRNPTSNIHSNGYGKSELEILINHVTWMLFGDKYNGSFFSQGAAPKGILKVAESVSEPRLAEFRQQWMSMIAGVNNAHRTPVIRANEMEWINLQMNNTDMQFTKWQEYLIQVACAEYKISPDEIGFKISNGGGNDNKPLFESNNAADLKYSRDKGLKPLLKFYAAKLNKYIINPINPDFELAFVGLDSETEASQVTLDIQKVGSFMGYKEIRRKYGLPDSIDKDDLILNGIWLQAKNAADQVAADTAQQQQDPNAQQEDLSTDQQLQQDNPLYN